MENKIRIHNVSRETLEEARSLALLHSNQLNRYLDELLWWNQKVNLVSRGVSRETLQEHLVHSLLPVPLNLLNGIDFWLDAGTGGGLPGIPLAIHEGGKNWLLNDIVGKKVTAVRQIAWNLPLKNLKAVAGHVEKIDQEGFEGVVTKHAFHAGDFWKMMRRQSWKRLIMYKGAEEASKELNEVASPVNAEIYQFDFGDSEPFYKGKGLLVLTSMLETLD